MNAYGQTSEGSPTVLRHGVNGAQKTTVQGTPDPGTSARPYIERFNLTIRMTTRPLFPPH